MAEAVIVIGGGGHAKVVIDCIRASGDRVAGILDDALAPGTEFLGTRVLGSTADCLNYPGCRFVIAIGSNAVRQKLDSARKLRWYTAIHPSAVVSPSARIGEGSVVMPRAVINAGAVVGRHCIVNTGAIVEHDNRLEDYVHISPAAALGGTVRVGSGSHIGIGACVRNNISICGGCIIGAGAAVVKNITEPGTYAGVPARKIR